MDQLEAGKSSGMLIQECLFKRDGQWIIVGVSYHEASFIPKNRKSGVIYHDIAVLGSVFDSEEGKIMLNTQHV